ncbi:MAG: hypothetical protein ACI4BH_11070 [Muribaculaceae bacterium]
MTTKHKYITSLAMVAAMALVATSCKTDDVPYTEPEPITADNMGVYFPNTNESMVMRADADEPVINVTVARTNTKDAASVPIQVVSKTDNISCPAQVEFAAGAAEATITLSYSNLETTPRCEMMIDEHYGNPYKIKDGSMRFGLSVYKLKTISESVEVQVSGSGIDYFAGVKNMAIYQLGNDNRFIWRNFLGAGFDLQFRIDGNFDAENVHNSYGAVTPLNHYSDDEYGWYLMDDEQANNGDNDSYSAWTPQGCATPISSYIYFYYPYEGYSYFYIDLGKYEYQTSAGTAYYSYGSINSAIIDDGDYVSFYYYLYY